MNRWRVHRATQKTLKAQPRLFWSLADQAVVSGSTVLTSILILRALGLADFGRFSFIVIVLQSLASAQIAVIIAPMMTNYERRRSITSSSYFSAMILHQLACLLVLVAIALGCEILHRVFGGEPLWHVDAPLLALTIISTQCQDLVRRFCFVSDRPRLAVLSDTIAYLGRLAALTVLNWQNELDLRTTWLAICFCNALACTVLVRDYMSFRIRKHEFLEITRAHSRHWGWLLGSAATQWISGSLYLIIIGAVLGAEPLGTIRAIQNIVGATNVVLQSLENFVPSAAMRIFLTGGRDALIQYVRNMCLAGAAFFVCAVTLGAIFINPIMNTIYGRMFEDQAALFICFGAFYGLGYMQAVLAAGLRSLDLLGEAFWFQTVVSIGTLPAGWLMAGHWGALGAASALLLPRLAIIQRLWLVLGSVKREQVAAR